MVNFLSYCLVGLLSFSVLTAQAARTVVVQPGELLPTYGPGIGPDAFIDSRDWNATISDQKGTRHSVPVVREKKYSWPSFRGALKNALKVNPGQLAVTGVVAGLLAGVDYVFENSQLQRKVPGDSAPLNSYKWKVSGNGLTAEASTPLAAFEDVASRFCWDPWENCTVINYVRSSPTAANAVVRRNYKDNLSNTQEWGFSASAEGTCPAGYTVIADGSCRSDNPQLVPVVDSDLDGLVSGISDPSFAADAAPDILSSVPGSFDYPDSETFGGPNSIDLPGEITTTTNPTTGDTTVVESLPSIQLEYGTSPLSITSTQTTVTNTYQNGTQTSTSVSTETNTSVETPAAEIPTDCDFMPTVCSFIDWVKTPFNEEEPDLSEFISDEDFEREINFSSNASCPGPSMIATSHGTYEFSWEPACQWAGMVKPLVIIAALIAAIFINLGMARGNE